MASRATSEFVLYLCDRLRPLGPVEPRRMFGGHGLFLDGLMFAVVLDEELYLKADDSNRPNFEARGMRPFTYARQGRDVSLGYYAPGADALEEDGLLLELARSSVAAAVAKGQRPRRKLRR